MYTLLYTNRSAMVAQQDKLDVISNNLANITTVGYKKMDTSFTDLYSRSLDRLGYPVSDGAKNLFTGTGVKSTEDKRQFTQGSLSNTEVTTDLAIDGEGLFKVYRADNTAAYTRNGSFKVDGSGMLVDNNGHKVSVVDNNGNEVDYSRGEFNLRDGFTMDKDGGIYVEADGKDQKIGSIKTYTAVGDASFISVGESLFIPKDGVNVFETTGRNILQGHLENSNVDSGVEMTNMIITQRAFQLNSSALKTADDMWGMINNLR